MRYLIWLTLLLFATDIFAAGAAFTLSVREESNDQPTICRAEIRRADAPGKQIPIRLTVPAGIGVVIDRKVELTLPAADYHFRFVRGPEYRVVSGKFTLERTSQDAKTVQLPRMINMLADGWTSGDCSVLPSPHSLPLRMAAEDVHVAAVMGQVDAKPIPRRDSSDPIEYDPLWIRTDANHHDGLIGYGEVPRPTKGQLPIQWISGLQAKDAVKVAIENPFAWSLPVWLASERIDGIFLMGDWLRLDRKSSFISDGRRPIGPSIEPAIETGRWAITIYQNILEAGLRIPPMAGGGSKTGNTPVGYNRLYVAASAGDRVGQAHAVSNADQWWQAAWNGQSVVTNGPLLQPTLEGKLPGHVFTARDGETLVLHPELNLATRDPVDYLDVVHNGTVHYSARLDEFAKAGGEIPPLRAKESGWVMVRVVTLYEKHYRAALSAPWYIEFDGERRVTEKGVKFFQDWLNKYEQRLKKLPQRQIKQHAPHIRQAREFWKIRAANAARLSD